MKNILIPFRCEQELANEIAGVSKRVGLPKSTVMREALRRGLPLIAHALDGGKRKSFVEALLELKGIEMVDRHCPAK